jgi:hypothetical protein
MENHWLRDNRELTRIPEIRRVENWPCSLKDDVLRRFIDIITAEMIELICDYLYENPPSESTIHGLIRMCYILGDPEIARNVKKVIWQYTPVIEWFEENRARHWDDYWRRKADKNLSTEDRALRLHDNRPFQLSDTSKFSFLFKEKKG